MRRRDAVLEALELLREVNPDFTVPQLIAFLQVGDDEAPLPLPDLRRRAGMTTDLAWKAARALAGIEVADGDGLIGIRRWPTGAVVACELTLSGRRLCQSLDAIIGEAAPIVQPLLRAPGSGPACG